MKMPQSEPKDLNAPAFPPGFLWGAATAAHQVEGDNVMSDWWQHEREGRLPVSGRACGHYELFRRDFDLAQSWGHTAHRFSIEWARIEPEAGQWDEKALNHYVEVTEALRERGLEPVVTLHHFTNPAWFAQRGGWLQPDSPAIFRKYVERVIGKLRGRVRYWLTINEPTVYVRQGFIEGHCPPFLRGRWGRAWRAFRNLAEAHRAAFNALHQDDPNVLVSFAHNAPVVEACRLSSRRDRVAARLRDFALNRLFFCLVGGKLERATARADLDYIAINYYTRMVVRAGGSVATALFGRICRTHPHENQGPVSSIGWESYPRGLRSVIDRFGRYGLPILITENGIATDDEQLRLEFIRDHLEVLNDSIRRGVDVRGYLYWTLMDNYEWTSGFDARFGLAGVNPETMVRSPRPCVRYLADVFSSTRRAARHS
jgi:beta-glucosidase